MKPEIPTTNNNTNIDYLFGVSVDDINHIYFSAWCIRVSDGQSLRIVGNVEQILLADAEYS